jgi:outer membrane protein assembly factor BamD
MRFRIPVLAIAGLAFLVGCATDGVEEYDPTRDWSAEKLYREAKRKLERREYLSAVEYFETLESRYPFGEYTQQAQLDIAYAYMQQDEFENAISAADQFIKLHPRHKAVDYAYYIKGLCNFSRGQSTMERLFPRDMSRVDQSWLKSAFADFDTLIRRYPNSTYVADAKQRMVYLRDQMAHHELLTGEFYYGRGAMVAAVNRAKYLIEHYDRTPYTADALALMAKAYTAMGKSQLAQETLDILALNNPDHDALQPAALSIDE